MDGGFLLPSEADPVWAGDIDRMFISLVPQGYSGADAALSAPVEAWLELEDITCDGAASVLRVGDVMVPPHGLSIATGYDDSYNLTPERVLRHILLLGYTAVPLLIFGVLIGIFKYFSQRKYRLDKTKRDVRDVSFNIFLLLTFLILPTTSTKILNTFNCDKLDDGRRVLKADLSIDCDSSVHKLFMLYAYAMIVVFPVGIPMMYAVMLYKARKHVDPGQDNILSTQVVRIIAEVAIASESEYELEDGDELEENKVEVVEYIVDRDAVEKAVQVGSQIERSRIEKEMSKQLSTYVLKTKNVSRVFWHKGDGGSNQLHLVGIEIHLDEEGALKEAVRRREETEKQNDHLAMMKFLYDAYEPRCWW